MVVLPKLACVRIPDVGPCFPTGFARCALVAAALRLLPAAGAAATLESSMSAYASVRPPSLAAPPTVAAPASRCSSGEGPSSEPASISLARSAVQARYRPVYWNPFQVPDSLIQSRLDILARRSPPFAAALERLRETRFFTLIATAEQADLVLGLDCLVGPVRSGVLSDVGYMAGTAQGDIVGAFVRVDMNAIRALANRRVVAMVRADSIPADATAATIDDVFRISTAVDVAMARIVDDVLIHEVWGHVVPVADRRHESGRCPDPRPDEDPLSSCVIQRENWLRTTLGLPLTEQYGIIDSDPNPEY